MTLPCSHLFLAPHAQVGSGYASECPVFSGFVCLTLRSFCVAQILLKEQLWTREKESGRCHPPVLQCFWMKGAGWPGHCLGITAAITPCPGQYPSSASWHWGPDEGPASLHMERDTRNVWLGLSEDNKRSIRPSQTALDE